jgi:hypothetical protein
LHFSLLLTERKKSWLGGLPLLKNAIPAVDAGVLISLSVVECHQPNIDVALPK